MPAVKILGACLVLAGLAGGDAAAGDLPMTTPAGSFNLPVISLREARFHTVIRQHHDFSCGSAAVATLLTYHYDRPMGEDEVFSAMFQAGDQETIRRSGFSMADMQSYLGELGYHADGFRISLDELAAAAIPAITLINTHGYSHFVVVKGIRDGDVLVGDPAAGLRVVRRAEFEAIWVGISFVIRDEADSARRHFNQSGEWMVRRKAPFASAIDRRGLATFSAMLPGLFEF
ncbi:MAG TPA: C39 family peptidase [Rhodospirillaceae bacterium]|nr:C39 family peptidase [Rhodospirillaceae bacterium]